MISPKKLFKTLVFFALPTWAVSPILDCNRYWGSLERPSQDNSIEVEIGSEGNVMSLFTTTDGTIGPVLNGAELPPKIAKKLKQLFPAEDPKKLPWEYLDPAEQREVIINSAKENKHDFFKARVVPGLRYKDPIELRFDKPTIFFNAVYPAGKHSFPPELVFGPKTKIEFMGPDNVTKDLGFELHLRKSINAGENLANARTLASGVNYQIGNVHQHEVAKVRMSPETARPLATHNPVEAARVPEYYRRIELFAQMESISQSHTITMNEKKDPTGKYMWTNFGNMKRSYVTTVYDYFFGGANTSLGSKLKIAWVGFRAHDYYDSPEKLWGLEFRDLPGGKNQMRLQDMLNCAQNSLEKNDFGIPPDKIERWVKKYAYDEATPGGFFKRPVPEAYNPAKMAKALSETYYSDTAPEFSTLPEAIRKSLEGSKVDVSKLNETFKAQHKDNLAVSLLGQDWSRDPLFFEHPEVIQQIQLAQSEAIQRLAKGEKSSDVMKFFIKKSGIHYMYGRSIGMPENPRTE